jgi:hypothetical protein
LQVVDDSTIANTIDQAFLCRYVVLPAVGTRGGVLLACSQDQFSMTQAVLRNYSITATIARLADSAAWTITGVYMGPKMTADKMVFLQELWQIKQSTSSELVTIG